MPGDFDDQDVPFDQNNPAMQFFAVVVDAFFGAEQTQDPNTIKERVDAYLRLQPSPPRQLGVGAEAQAMALAEAAWEEQTDRALDLAIDALKLWPDCTEAYTFLGLQAMDAPELAIPLFTLAVLCGLKNAGSIVDEQRGSLWDAEEAQPFLQALMGLARANRDAGALDVATMHYLELLQFDERDPLGARYDLLALYLVAQDRQAIRALFEAFPDEQSAAWAYGAALDAFQRLGDSDESRKALAAATARNPHLAAYLLEMKPLPTEIGPELSAGGPEEGAVYAELLRVPWAETRNALGWLRAQSGVVPAAKTAPPVKERRSGPRQI